MPVEDASLLSTLIDQEVSQAELMLWPLLHGSLVLPRNLEAIQCEGLLSGEQVAHPTNSFRNDRILGRTGYVFLSLFRIRGGYGGGQEVVVDPAVLSFPGVTCRFWDLGRVFNEVKELAEGNQRNSPPWILREQALRDIVGQYRVEVVQRCTRLGVPAADREIWIAHKLEERVIRSSEFREYADSESLEVLDFFSKLQQLGKQYSFSHLDFFERRLPKDLERKQFDFEVMVPGRVPSRYLLGYRLDGVWHQWNEPTSADVAQRLARVLSFWESEA